MKYHVHINNTVYTYNNPYDMYDLIDSFAGSHQAEEACSWAELAYREETYYGRGFTVRIEDEIEADGRAIII